MCGRGVKIRFSVAEGETEEEGEECERYPDGQRDEDHVCEAGCWDG